MSEKEMVRCQIQTILNESTLTTPTKIAVLHEIENMLTARPRQEQEGAE